MQLVQCCEWISTYEFCFRKRIDKYVECDTASRCDVAMKTIQQLLFHYDIARKVSLVHNELVSNKNTV